MPDAAPSRPITVRIWTIAMTVAAIGTAILWDADPGVNWGLWVTTVAAALMFVSRASYGRIGTPTLVTGLWAAVLAFGLAATTYQERHVLIVLVTLVLLAVALVMSGQPALDRLDARAMAESPFRAIGWVARGAVLEAVDASDPEGAHGARQAIRGAAITVPVVLVLVVLLAEADPLFAAVCARLSTIAPDAWVGRTLFGLGLLAVVLGAYGGVRRGFRGPGAASAGSLAASSADPPRLGDSERRALLVSVAAVVWLFVASAVVSLWADPAARAGTGVTYAEYARRGFGQLTAAATLVALVVLAADRLGGRADAFARRVALAALGAVSIMLGVAFTRVLRYEWVYGYTVTRVQAQAYMIVLALVLAALALEVAGRAARGHLARRAVGTALAAFTVFAYWNADAWVAGRNMDRYNASGDRTLDVHYLTSGTRDGVATVVARLGELREPLRSEVVRGIRCSRGVVTADDGTRWFEWNARATQRRHTLARLGGRLTDEECRTTRTATQAR